MHGANRSERVETIVIGGGQAGLSVGYHLMRKGVPFLILDASERIGDAWRKRWDSLRLFTPARFDGISGMPFPGDPNAFPTKDEMAQYLERYAAHFRLPVRSGVRVDGLSKRGDAFVVTAGDREFEARQVVVAMSTYQRPRIPSFAQDLDPTIVQFHSSEYRNPSQLGPGRVLLVGAGNSAAEIAAELARNSRSVVVAGPDTGQIPFRFASFAGRLFLARFVLRVVFHRVLTQSTPIGRKARPNLAHKVTPLIRVKSKDLAAFGVERASRVVGARNGRPLLDDGGVVDAGNVIWCTGFEPGFSWIDLPVIGERGAPIHERGVATGVPGLYFVGLHFLYAMSSGMVHGVGRDAEYIAGEVAARAGARQPAGAGDHLSVTGTPISSRAVAKVG